MPDTNPQDSTPVQAATAVPAETIPAAHSETATAAHSETDAATPRKLVPNIHTETALLLDWYDRCRRVLPWREDPTPYHVWLSEIMLQQTRVEAAISYYNRFLAELPDVTALAAAPEEKYMKLWEGLGYYSRIRNMHKAAVQIVEDYGGRIPGTAEELVKLPGIGEYTAAAIASIAFGQPVSSVDGNLLRVFSRMTCYGEDIKASFAKKVAADYYRSRIPKDRPGDYNQALMDLGATICLPNGAPHCENCPWSALCQAHLLGKETDFPKIPEKNPRTIEKRTILLIHDGESVLIRKRPDAGLLAGLYEYPNRVGSLTKGQVTELLKERGVSDYDLKKTSPARHIFSHKEWHMTGYEITVPDLSALQIPDCIPARFSELKDVYTIPSAFTSFSRIFYKKA